MSDQSTPRIDGSLLQEYTNRTVRIIGKVEQINDNTITFYTPSLSQDDLKIKLTTSPDLQFVQGNWFEIIGRVLDDLSVRAIDVQNFGEGINEKAIAGLAKYSHKASEIFY